MATILALFDVLFIRLKRTRIWTVISKYKYLLLCVVIAFVVLLCFSLRKPHYDDTSYTYLVTDGDTTYVFEGSALESLSFDGFHIEAASEKHSSRFLFSRGQSVTVIHGSDTYRTRTRRETVTGLIKRLHIKVNEGEMIAINLAGTSPVVHIDTRLTYTHKEHQTVYASTKYFPNYLLAYEEVNVLQEGADGEVVNTFEDTYENGKLISSTLIYRSSSSATTKIVEYGTLVKEVERDDTLKEVHYYHNSSGGYLVFTSGYSMTFSSVAQCSATAYYGGTITATGHSVGTGIIAIDPTVFSYHDRMYITCVYGDRAYGIGQAEDCGGAVKGYTVDLWFPTYADCVSWGRRPVYCYLLD